MCNEKNRSQVIPKRTSQTPFVLSQVLQQVTMVIGICLAVIQTLKLGFLSKGVFRIQLQRFSLLSGSGQSSPLLTKDESSQLDIFQLQQMQFPRMLREHFLLFIITSALAAVCLNLEVKKSQPVLGWETTANSKIVGKIGKKATARLLRKLY